MFTNTKSKITEKKKGYVYEIQCKGDENGSNCPTIYIGETGQIEGNREAKHKSDLKIAQENRKVILKQRDEEYSKLKKRKELKELKELHVE